jgi:molybdopterin-guanine dinucleotide biosynthesis protein
MANAARKSLEERTVEVNRMDLLKTLIENKERHIQDYEVAVEGYKRHLLQKIQTAYEDTKKIIDNKYKKFVDLAEALESVEEIEKQNDFFVFTDRIVIDMRVPRCYSKEYDAAIAIANWDVRDTLELTHAEFTCFVRDLWDWKMEFNTISQLYKTI